MKKLILTSFFFIAFTIPTNAQSFLARITGIDVDLNRGTVQVKAPEITAIPQMIQNLPKDVGQALLNPAAPVLATAIRFSRGQALNRGVQPIPANIKQQLAPYFPPSVLANARWTTANGVSIDGALKNWFNQEGAVTLDEVIVFSDVALTNNVELWAHELTHVLQYSQMGVETFAFQYSYDWNGLEAQARTNASSIIASINSTSNGNRASWAYIGQEIKATEKLTWQIMNQSAKLAIPPVDCIWINNQYNTTGNKCPVPIMVSGVVLRRLMDNYTFTYPCNERTCLFPAGGSGPLISPPGHLVVGVTAAYQF